MPTSTSRPSIGPNAPRPTNGLHALATRAERLPSAEQLIGFLDGLRRSGWSIDLANIQNACRLLARARENSKWAERLPWRLALLVATNPAEQEQFPKLWQDAFARMQRASGEAVRQLPAVVLPPTTAAEKGETRTWYGRSGLAAAALACLAAAVAAGVFWFTPEVPEPEQPPQVLEEAPSEPGYSSDCTDFPCELPPIVVPARTVEQTQDFIDPRTDAVTNVALVLPVLAFLAWFAWRWWHRLVWLTRGMRPPTARLTRLRLPEDIRAAMFSSPRFRDAAQNLRRHQPTVGHDIDVERTIVATIAAGGLFTEVRRQVARLPEYVVLLERRAANDHLAQLSDLALERLSGEGVALDAYYYQDDPRLVVPFRIDGRLVDPASDAARPLDLLELASRHEDHRLVLLGTAEAFFHPITHAVEQWVREFQVWASRTVMSTRRIEEWTRDELQLLDEGFSLATARSSGLFNVAERVAFGQDDEPTLLEGRIVQRRPPRIGSIGAAQSGEAVPLVAALEEVIAENERAGGPDSATSILRRLIELLRDPATESDAVRAFDDVQPSLDGLVPGLYLGSSQLWRDIRQLLVKRRTDSTAPIEHENVEVVLALEDPRADIENSERVLTSGELVIGRDEDADWSLPDTDAVVSRKHCVVGIVNGRPQVRDLSINGLFIDDNANPVGRGNSVPLVDGMLLRVGEYRIRVRFRTFGPRGRSTTMPEDWSDGRIEQLEVRLAAYRSEDDDRSAAYLSNDLARLHAKRGELDAAQALLEEELAYFREERDWPEASMAMSDLAQLHQKRGQYRLALPLLEERLHIARELNNNHEKARGIAELGLLKLEMSELEESWRLLEERLHIVRDLGDRHEESRAMGDLAKLHAARGQKETAVEFAEASLVLARDLRGRGEVVRALRDMGDVQERLGNRGGALQILREAEAKARDEGDERTAKSLADEVSRLGGVLADGQDQGSNDGAQRKALLALIDDIDSIEPDPARRSRTARSLQRYAEDHGGALLKRLSLAAFEALLEQLVEDGSLTAVYSTTASGTLYRRALGVRP